jgi:hypothetical protein
MKERHTCFASSIVTGGVEIWPHKLVAKRRLLSTVVLASD